VAAVVQARHLVGHLVLVQMVVALVLDRVVVAMLEPTAVAAVAVVRVATTSALVAGVVPVL
jgi:hypothetical protein